MRNPHIAESEFRSDYSVRAPAPGDILSAALRSAYSDTLPENAAFDDLLRVLNWVELSEC